MQIPQPLGQAPQYDFVIYTACDTEYFDQFGKIFCTSAQQAGRARVHLHLFNPRDDQLEWCRTNDVSATWEQVDAAMFAQAAANLMSAGGEELRRTQVAMAKGNDVSVQQRIAKTYYACARFIRLAQVPQSCPTVFACDIDAVVRKPVPKLGTDRDFYIHQIFGNKARFLAGGLYLNPSAGAFVQAYAAVLRSTIEQDRLYWSVDQDVLDPLVPRFRYGQLPSTLIDWNMRSDSVIWTAKGARKNNTSFVNEQQRYAV